GARAAYGPPRARGRSGPQGISCPVRPRGRAAHYSHVHYAVSLTPDGTARTRPANTSGQATFTVTNTGLCGDTYNFSCSVGGSVTCSNVSPASAALGTGANVVVSVTYSLSTPGTGNLILTARGEAGLAQDNGSYNLTAADS